MTAEVDLRQAAAAIRAHVGEFQAETLTNPYWQGVTFREGIYAATGGAGGRLAALMADPDVALAIADVLDQAAKSAPYLQAGDGRFPPFTTRSMAVARAVLGRDVEAVAGVR